VHLASIQKITDPDVVLAAGEVSLLAAAEALRMTTANLNSPSLRERTPDRAL
jgi:hypothetical protein